MRFSMSETLRSSRGRGIGARADLRLSLRVEKSRGVGAEPSRLSLALLRVQGIVFLLVSAGLAWHQLQAS